jgi:hypothetical protein
MSEFKFSCPKCGQKMAGEEQYIGAQITCPGCHDEIVVPQPISPGRLQVKTVAVAAPPAPPPPPQPTYVAPSRPAYVPKTSAAGDSKSKTMMIVGVICLVVLCPIIFFFAFPDQVGALESKFGFADRKVGPNDGGELGHIAELNAVLEATDPDRGYEESQKEKARYKKKAEEAQRAAEQAEKEAAIAEANTPLGEVSWNLNPSAENIPTGKPHGSISKTNFVADLVHLEGQSGQYLLTLRQGTNGAPDCELLVYLQLKPDEQIEGKSWTISASQKSGAPRIVKKWKANPKFAPQQKVYAGNYAMLLEFGQDKTGRIPATIYVALPDAEKSFVGGEFKVDGFRKRFSFKDDAGDF